jgi:hypothetical protein
MDIDIDTDADADATMREERGHFIEQLDDIASSLSSAVANSRGALREGNRSATSSSSQPSTANTAQEDSSNSVSYDNQIEMLSRLIELAANSTVRTLMGSSVVNGRRFDNTSRAGQEAGSQDSTFQEFVTQLHNGLLNDELSRNVGDENMSFFRAFRFDSEGTTQPLNTVPPFPSSSHAESVTSSSPSANPAASNATEPENGSTDFPVVPVMIIGLRSVQQPRDGPIEDVDWFMRGGDRATRQASAASEQYPANSSQNETTHEAASQSNTIQEEPHQPQQRHQQTSWVIFVMGNSFAWNHPLLSAPSLMSESPTYDDLLILQELIGQVKPQVTTQQELNKHDHQLFELVPYGSGSVTDYQQVDTLDGRCQICLTEYQTNEVVRKLSNCNHLYHKDCIDTWLLKGKNNCPLCRSKGVHSGDDAPQEQSL